MKQLSLGEKAILYDIERISKKNIILRARGGYISVSAPRGTSTSAIEKVLRENFERFYSLTQSAKEDKTVHFGGIAYKASLIPAAKSSVSLDGDNIVIKATHNDEKHYKEVLWRFYKRTVEQELCKLIYAAEADFPEIKFPKISVRYMKSRYGHYKKSDNTIKLSSLLAKHDFKYIKLVLYHELTHALQFNHSEKFYKIFEQKLPGATANQKLLRKEKYNDIF